MNLILVKVLGILIFSILFCSADVEEIYNWNSVEYENLPKPDDHYVARGEPYYIPGNGNVQGIAYQASTGLFVVAVARARRGIPSTVNAFCADKYKKGSNGPKVWGFPNYEINELKAEYFDAKKRSIRSADDDQTQEEVVDGEKVEKPESEVNIEKDQVLKTERDTEEKPKLKDKVVEESQNSEFEESDESLDEEDSGKTGNHANKHKNKDRNKYPSYSSNYHQKPTHTYVEKPSYTHHTHGSHNKPQYTHGTSQFQESHASKPNYHHTNKPDNYYNKPSHSSSKPPKPHKNKYGTLSQIHSVHSHASKPVHYVPLPYKEPTQPPTKEKYPARPVQSDKNLISVYHPLVDDVCDRVWFLDGGELNYPEGDIVIQRLSLWVIDIPRTSRCGEGPYPVRRRFDVPRSIVQDGDSPTCIALDHKKGGSCDDVFAYFPNFYNDGKITVYDYKNNKAWSFQEHFSFYPVFSAATYTLEGKEYTDEMGVFSITLGWRNARGYRTAYYISPTTTVQFAVSTEVLKQENLAPTSYNFDDFRPLGNRGCGTQAVTHVFDSKNGVIFYGDRDGLSLRCWNVRKPPTPDYNDVVYHDPKFVYIHEIFIDERGYLWALSNRNRFYFKYGFDTNRVNIRLYRVHVDEAVKNTVCANDDDEYRSAGVFDYPKELPEFIL